MTDFPDVRFYWGAGNGTSAKTLRIMQEPHVMISYVSYPTLPWDCIESLFVDCGGYSMMNSGNLNYETPHTEYLEWVEEHDAELYALRDYPCEPHIREKNDTTVAEHQRWTIEAHTELLIEHHNMDIDAEPVAVVQGWETKDYERHIDSLRDHGILSQVEHVGIGSVCRRGEIDNIRDVLTTVGEELSDKKLHAFGVKYRILQYLDVRDVLWSVDSSAWYYHIHDDKHHPDQTTWHVCADYYTDYEDKLWETVTS